MSPAPPSVPSPAEPAAGVSAVAFDLMDTLVRDPFREALTAATGRPLQELVSLRDAQVYPAFERDEIDEDAYWASCPRAGIAVDPVQFHRVRGALVDLGVLPG